jgi:multiple sugar transport system permease protein
MTATLPSARPGATPGTGPGARPGPRSGVKRRRFRIERLAPYGFVAPSTVLIAVLMLVPIGIVIGYSLYDNVIVQQQPVFQGIANYITLFTTGDFFTAIGNTAIFTVSSVVAHMVLGVLFAMLLNTKLLPNWVKASFRVVFILPWLFTTAIIAILWRLILDPHGVINYLLEQLHVIQQGVPWFGDPHTAMLSIIVMNVWAGYPFFMLSLLAGLQGIPTDLYEAARVDGANGFQQFLHVTLPQLRPILIAMAMLDMLWTTQQFALIWLTTGGGPINVTEMLSTFTYKLAFSSFQFSQASAAAVVLLAFSVIVAFFYVRSQRSVES